MNTVKNSQQVATPAAKQVEAQRISLSSRWMSAPGRPRLVSFSWAAVAPMGSAR